MNGNTCISDGRARFTLLIDPRELDFLRATASQEDMSVTALIRRIIRKYERSERAREIRNLRKVENTNAAT